ncbi:MAG: glycosyltransferase [Candidatus Kuenenbacteria bacterium]
MFDIIMFGMNNFSKWFEKETFNRSANILKNLLEDKRIGKVFYIDLLPHTIKGGAINYIRNCFFKKHETSREKIIHRDFFSVCHQIQISEFLNVSKGFFAYSTVDSIFGEKIMIKKINKLLKKLEFKNTILWSCNPMFCGYFGKLGETISCFDAIDNWMEYPAYINQKQKLEKNYKLIKKKANIIFTVSEELINLFFQNKENVHCVSQGIDLRRFQKELICPEDIKQISHPIIGCVGVINNRLNFDLIFKIIKKNTNLNFVFIGPIWQDKSVKFEIEKLSHSNNVHFLGPKHFKEVPSYINQFDVCFTFYKVNLSTKCGDSMKMYEYLALGKPIIATNTGGVEKFSNLIEIVNTEEEFNNALKKCLKEKNENLKRKRIEEVKKYDWKKKVEEMMDKIIISKLKC